MNLYRFNPDFPLKDSGKKAVGLTSIIASTNCCQLKGISLLFEDLYDENSFK